AKPDHLRSVVEDWSNDRQAFHVPWGKLMMWVVRISDTVIFSCFLVGYMYVRMTTTEPWPDPMVAFALTPVGQCIPLVLIAIMAFIQITSSGTVALAVRYSHFRDRKKTALFMFITAAFGASFVGMQAFEWTKLIEEGVRPWTNPFGAPQFGSAFFMITGFHGLHVSLGVIYLSIVATKVLKGHYDRKNDYSIVEIAGLYW